MDYSALKTDLYQFGVYDAWQYVENTCKQIETAEFCRDIISDVIIDLGEKHESWLTDLYGRLFSQDEEKKVISITDESLPNSTVKVGNRQIEAGFLLDKLTKDFFQYIRNSFDSISQIANSALLASMAKKTDSVDFPKMLDVFNRTTYSTSFPAICNWYNSISSAALFIYIDAFCNRTKHTLDVYLELSMSLLDSKTEAIISPFSKKAVSHGKRDLLSGIDVILDFTKQSFLTFLNELQNECPKRIYVATRYHQLFAYQQKFKTDSSNDFSIVYIETNLDITALPQNIEVLLINQSTEGEIISSNCKFDTIYVKRQNSNNDYIAKYTAIGPLGEDNMKVFRKYELYTPRSTELPMMLQAMRDWKKTSVFYHANPYVRIKTVSDDEEFLARIQLPI